MRLILAASLVALPAIAGEAIPNITQQDKETCEAGGGCLVITREAFHRMLEARARSALSECRNFMRGEI